MLTSTFVMLRLTIIGSVSCTYNILRRNCLCISLCFSYFNTFVFKVTICLMPCGFSTAPLSTRICFASSFAKIASNCYSSMFLKVKSSKTITSCKIVRSLSPSKWWQNSTCQLLPLANALQNAVFPVPPSLTNKSVGWYSCLIHCSILGVNLKSDRVKGSSGRA